VVSVNTRVIYRFDSEPGFRAHLLVRPLDLTGSGDELSAASPLGAALLGLRVGDRMPFCDNRSGGQHTVMVEGIGWQWTEGKPSGPPNR
jgi:regulator of nucleoside diphosphate kinase